MVSVLICSCVCVRVSSVCVCHQFKAFSCGCLFIHVSVVIVMRLYEQYVRVEQIVGVSGWTEATTDQIQAALQQQDKAETDTTTPTCSSIVRRVQAEIESFKKRGVADYPKGTPTMPKKQRKEGSNELD